MKIIILAGGHGTRLQEETRVKPKPTIEIGKKPILWHIMKIYSTYGFSEFVVALGYKGEWIKKYFLDYYQIDQNLTVHTKNGHVDVYERDQENWKVHLVDTGNDTMTGGRVKRLKDWIGNETFMMTYGDGVGNINIKELVAFHKKQAKIATVTVVRPEARFGGIKMNDGIVENFVEKPQLGEGWINGGFFVLEPKVFDYIEGDGTLFEREPMENLVKDGQLAGYKHNNFWQPMDTLRDVKLLNELWAKNRAPWKIWE